jgi:DNA-binding response OmpR family regulator
MTKRILVVDGEAGPSKLLQFRLRNLDYEVLSANSGTEALNRARCESPDMILLDLLLPDLDGLTVCEILRQLPATRKTPVFLLSAVTSEATRCAAKIAGASGFLEKPRDFDQLAALFKTVFASKPAGEVSLVESSLTQDLQLNDPRPTKGRYANHNPTRRFASR